MNKKSLYRPPKVKPSKRPKKPLPEWNSFQTDLDKYKLSSTEILKKKINAVSKNKELAKKDWLETLSQIQTGKYITDDTDKKPKKKIDLVPRHRFQKEDRSIIQRQRHQSALGKHINANANCKMRDNGEEGDGCDDNDNDEEDDEIKMIYHNEDDIEASETKVEKNIIVNENKASKGNQKKNNSSYKDKGNNSNGLLFEGFEETLKQMEKEIQSNNAIIDKKLNEQQKEIELNNKLTTKLDNKGKGTGIGKGVKLHNRSDNDDIEDYDEDEENEGKEDVNGIQKDIDKKFNNLNDIEDCMKRLDCMLDDSKQKSMKMKFDLDFREGDNEGYRSEGEQIQCKGQNSNCKDDTTNKALLKNQQKIIKKADNNKPLLKQNKTKCNNSNTKQGSTEKPIDYNNAFNEFNEDDNAFRYRSAMQKKKDDIINYDNNLRDSELYLTDRKLQDALIKKEMQIRQNLQTSPNKDNAKDDLDYNDNYYLNDHKTDQDLNYNQDAVNQARLLSIKNELLKSNKMNQSNNSLKLIQEANYQAQIQQEQQEHNPIPYSSQSINNEYYTGDYDHLPQPTKITIQENKAYPSYNNNDGMPIQSKNYIQQQPPIKRSIEDVTYNNSNPLYKPLKPLPQNSYQQPNKPLYSLTNYPDKEPVNVNVNQYCNRNDLEEEQPYQLKPNKLSEVTSSYNTGSQGKSIKIERNIIDITKHKAKVKTNELNMFDCPSKTQGLANNSNNKVPDVNANDPMNYFKNLLEKTKEEIDNLTQGLDDVQPSITSYPQTQPSLGNYTQQRQYQNQIPMNKDYYNYANNNKYHH